MIGFFFKQKNKYPARIYRFQHWDKDWAQRNFRPMGLYDSYFHPLLTRLESKEEEVVNEKCWRSRYHQFEDWNDLILSEYDNLYDTWPEDELKIHIDKLYDIASKYNHKLKYPLLPFEFLLKVWTIDRFIKPDKIQNLWNNKGDLQLEMQL